MSVSQLQFMRHAVLGVVAITITAWLGINIDKIWAGNADIAHHYALSYRVGETLNFLGPLADPSLGEMNYYPRGAHGMAAIVGRFANSTILGLNVTALLGILMIWLGQFWLLSTLPRGVAFASSAIFFALVVVTFSSGVADVYGAEVIGNFFLPQLLAQGIAIVGLAIAARRDSRGATLTALVWLCISVAICLAIHLKPAIEILGVLVLSFVATLLIPAGDTCGGLSLRQRLSVCVVLCSVSCLGMLLHPSFLAMSSISENDGVLPLKLISYPVGLLGLTFAVLLVSLILIRLWLCRAADSKYTAAKYIGFFGLASAASCLLQFVLLEAGYGSPYAVKKYVFSLTTSLLMGSAVICAVGVTRFLKANGCCLHFHRFPVASSCLLMGSCILFFIVPSSWVMRTSEIVALEKRVEQIATELGIGEFSQIPSAAIDLPGALPAVNYMLSIGILKTPRELATPQLLVENRLNEPIDFGCLILGKDSRYQNATKRGFHQIATIFNHSLPVIRVLLSESATSIRLNEPIPHTSDLLSFHSWSAAEPDIRWTNGTNASVGFMVSSNILTPTRIIISGSSFGAQQLDLSLNGERLIRRELDGTQQSLEVDLPGGLIRSGKNELVFYLPHARVPSVGDTRSLGFALRSIKFE